MTSIKLAYIAGFIDGEGTIGLYKHVNQHVSNGFQFVPQLSVGHTSRNALLQLAYTLGGTVCGPYKASNPKWKSTYQWTLTHNKALHAVSRILPYLSLKREQARLVIEAATILKRRRGAAGHGAFPTRLLEIYDELQFLNRKGRGPR